MKPGSLSAPASAVCPETAFQQLKTLLKKVGLNRRSFTVQLHEKNAAFEYDERAITNWKYRGIPNKEGLLYAIVQILVEHSTVKKRCTAEDVLLFLAPAGFPLVDIRQIAHLFAPQEFNAALQKYLPLFDHPLDDSPLPGLLPTYRTGFIGREQDIATLKALLLKQQLLTLWGPGGSGKTRLAVEIAKQIELQFRHGVCFVDLSAVHDAALVKSEIAQRVGIKEISGQALETTLADYFHHRHGVLVLDNFEHVLAATPLILDLLNAAPLLHILVTSREPLLLYDEQQYEVVPLRLPDTTHCPPDWEDYRSLLLQSEAVHLFIERARERKFNFALTHDNAAAVADICIALDGLPLVIELIASHINTFPPQAMLAQLQKSLSFASGRLRDLPERQRSAHRSLDWSHALLTEEEQVLFRRLAVFTGSFSMQAVETICHDAQYPASAIIHGIESLIYKSLLRQKEDIEGNPRFSMLETIREYALEQLQASDEAVQLFPRHAAFYFKQAEEAVAGLKGARQETCRQQLLADYANVRTALQRLLDVGDAEMALQLCAVLELFWYWCGYQQEGRMWLQRVLDSHGLSQAARAKALDEAGGFAWAQGDYTEARQLAAESLDIWRSLQHTEGMLEALNTLGLVAESQGELEAAIHLHEEGLALRRALNNPFRIAIALGNLGDAELYHHPDQPHRAIERFTESLACYQLLEDKRGMADMLVSLGDAALFAGNTTQAIEQFHQSLRLYQQVANMNRKRIARCLERLADAWGVLGYHAHSASLLGAAAAMRERYDIPQPPVYDLYYERTLNAARTFAGDSLFNRAYASGHALSLEAAVAFALEPPSGLVTLARWQSIDIEDWPLEPPPAGVDTAVQAMLLSPQALPTIPCTTVIPSWSAETPAGTWLELQLRARVGKQWTTFYRVVVWDSLLAQSRRSSFAPQQDEHGLMETEILRLLAPASAVQARVLLCSQQPQTLLPTLHSLTLCMSVREHTFADLAGIITASPLQTVAPLDVPCFSQYQFAGGDSGWCSPTALAMVLGYWYRQTQEPRLQPFVSPDSVAERVAPMVFDAAYDGTGNWAFNTAYAALHGLEAYVTQVGTLQQLARWLQAGVPIICSLAWKRGELDHAPVPESSGHLLVVVGFVDGGAVRVADPAGGDATQVLRTYRADQFLRCWQRHSSGAVYVVYPHGWQIPPPGADDAWG
jgi:predicted ATPase